ncbi:hypothetical protein LBK6_11615 [Leptospira borgpetersenii serovar Hardjo]|nr:hypothetical protein LBK6_11615 [Leptospira borgpetersenii serovar Hardjo]AMX65454.1 hypothetical protein LBK30_11675 [Leptospira borgpetersenii serovar Hardjo]AMX68664.1 hypothetical protein LBHA_11510 [Leptospira borgpetersenii serovar Hardjo]
MEPVQKCFFGNYFKNTLDKMAPLLGLKSVGSMRAFTTKQENQQKELRAFPKPEKKSAQSFYKFVIGRGNSRRSVIYGFSNGFYRWDTFVGVPTS